MIMAEMGRKLGTIVRVLLQRFRRSRTGSAVIRGIETTARSFGRVLHQLFLEVTGFTFLAIAGIGGITAFREYTRYHAGLTAGRGRLVLAIAFTFSFTWFGVSSFWRIRRRKKA
jgi:hypothetical protein